MNVTGNRRRIGRKKLLEIPSHVSSIRLLVLFVSSFIHCFQFKDSFHREHFDIRKKKEIFNKIKEHTFARAHTTTERNKHRSKTLFFSLKRPNFSFASSYHFGYTLFFILFIFFFASCNKENMLLFYGVTERFFSWFVFGFPHYYLSLFFFIELNLLLLLRLLSCVHELLAQNIFR